MPKLSSPHIKLLDQIDPSAYMRTSVGCLVVSHDGRIVLQLRDSHVSYPNCLATFGGAIEKGETPMQALVRELKEELGADVNPRDVISLGIVTEAITNYTEALYLYFWFDKYATITGCYEGRAKYYNRAEDAELHPKIMDDVRWLLQECRKRKLI